jgi:hypothetical protein
MEKNKSQVVAAKEREVRRLETKIISLSDKLKAKSTSIQKMKEDHVSNRMKKTRDHVHHQQLSTDATQRPSDKAFGELSTVAFFSSLSIPFSSLNFTYTLLHTFGNLLTHSTSMI